jgi:hypothetical protein
VSVAVVEDPAVAGDTAAVRDPKVVGDPIVVNPVEP